MDELDDHDIALKLPTGEIISLSAIKRERAERDLFEFIKQAWHIIEPGVEFVDNWHLRALAEHLQAVTNGDIDNLIVNIPPGCMKSILVSVAWPAWEWIKDPELRIMGASYGADLAIRDAMKCRDIVVSEWYQRNWPHVTIKKGSDQKLKYELAAGGWRMATSVGGRATGDHPDRKLIDDPLSATQATSDTERENALEWFDRTLSTRGESRGAKTVVVMQRLHEMDLTGHILRNHDKYEHICLPMEYEHTTRVSSIGWKDPRTTEGELLWPAMFPAPSVKRLKKVLGDYGASGQLQQRPTPAGGGLLNTNKFQLWPFDVDLPAFLYVVQGYDTAFTADTLNDPTACTVWGVFEHREKRCVMLLDAWAEHMNYPDLRQRVIDEWNSRYGRRNNPLVKARKADLALIENKGSGQALINDLASANVMVRSYDLPRGNKHELNKISRAHLITPLIDSGLVYILESTKHPGQPVSWAKPFIDQCASFPKGDADDYVDTFSMLLYYLQGCEWFDMPVAEDDDEDENPRDYYHEAKKAANPYDC